MRILSLFGIALFVAACGASSPTASAPPVDAKPTVRVTLAQSSDCHSKSSHDVDSMGDATSDSPDCAGVPTDSLGVAVVFVNDEE